MGWDDAMGATLRRLRLQQSVSTSELAAQVGVSRTTVWSWENGATKPRLDKVPALARALNMPENDLVLVSQAVVERGQRRTLDEEIAYSKECLAAAVGTTPDKIEITIKL